MNVLINNEQKVLVTLAPLTAGGNPATVDGVPSWTVTEGDATLEVAENGMSAWILSGEPNVTSKVAVSADADLGEGISTISDEIVVLTTQAGASSLGLSVSEPTNK